MPLSKKLAPFRDARSYLRLRPNGTANLLDEFAERSPNAGPSVNIICINAPRRPPPPPEPVAVDYDADNEQSSDSDSDQRSDDSDPPVEQGHETTLESQSETTTMWFGDAYHYPWATEPIKQFAKGINVMLANMDKAASDYWPSTPPLSSPSGRSSSESEASVIDARLRYLDEFLSTRMPPSPDFD